MKKTLRKTIAAMPVARIRKTQADEELTQRLDYQLFRRQGPLRPYLSFDHEVSTAEAVKQLFNLEETSVFPVPIHRRMEFVITILIFWKRHALVYLEPMKRKGCGSVG